MNNQTRERAAQVIFGSGSCLVDIEQGFPIALHEKFPDAPLSPYYFNLRPEGVKEGTLTENQILEIGHAMYDLGNSRNLFGDMRPVCAIPDAGVPFLDAILRYTNHDYAPRVFRLEKYATPLKKRAFRLEGAEADWQWTRERESGWKNGLMIDDLVSSSHSKTLAMWPISKAHGKVTDLLILINNSQGNRVRKELAQAGVTLHAVWDQEDLMPWALKNRYLTGRQYNAIMAYPARLSDYLRSVGHI